MKTLCYWLILPTLIYFSCTHKHTQSSPQHSLYTWDWGYLVITNYENKTMSVKQFYSIANHYLDSVNKIFPTNTLMFMAEAPGEQLPPAKDEDFINERQSHYLIEFGFEKKGVENLNTRRLQFIEIWAGRSDHTFYYNSLSKKFIDVLLLSDAPFDNTKLPVYARARKGKVVFGR